MLYVGLESGDEITLADVGKEVTVSQQIEAFRKAKSAGFGLSVTAILGLGGVERLPEHARAAGEALSAIDPDYIGILSLMLELGTRMARLAQKGEFLIPGPLELLLELRHLIAACEVTHAVFRTNHASNYLSLRGALPRDKKSLLLALDAVLSAPGKVRLKPERMRAL